MKNAASASSSMRSGTRGVAVRRNGSGWMLSSTTGDASAQFTTKAEAVVAARTALARKGGTLTVHGTDGKVSETLTLGRDTAVRLNAIEGVAMNATSRRLLRDVQASGMTPAQQLGAIVAAFKK
jgi:hypothetical protein